MKVFRLLLSQIRKPSVTIPKKHDAPNKITDNNQSISIGAINEKHPVSVRSASKSRKTS